MYFLYDICGEADLNPLWNVVGFVVKAIWIGIPIILIVLGMIDLGKAVIASKEDEVKKATKAFGKRFIYAVAVFLVVWLVTFVLDLASNVSANALDDYNENDWRACWCKINKGTDYVYKNVGTSDKPKYDCVEKEED